MRKRSKYRPKPVYLDNMAYIKESATPIALHESYLVDLKITNSLAMATLMQGKASKQDMDVLIAMSNIVKALCDLGFGGEYQDVATEGRAAIMTIVFRAVDKLRFVPTGPEIKALNDLMELHDAQMDVITVRDMERAIAFAKRKLAAKDSVFVLPTPALETT